MIPSELEEASSIPVRPGLANRFADHPAPGHAALLAGFLVALPQSMTLFGTPATWCFPRVSRR